jgi:hypothetical protein
MDSARMRCSGNVASDLFTDAKVTRRAMQERTKGNKNRFTNNFFRDILIRNVVRQCSFAEK